MRRLICGLGSLGLVILSLSAAYSQPSDRGGRGPGRDGPPPPLRGPLFNVLDKDHDGVLSAEEIQSAAESLKTLDRNGDGKLTEDELRPERGGPPGRGPAGAGPDDPGRPGAGRPGSDRIGPDRAGSERGAPDRPGADRGPPDRGGPPDRAAADRGGRDARREGPPDRGREGPDGRVGPGAAGPPSLLPPFAREGLRLTEEQRRQCDELDAEIREKLGKILTAEQKQQLEQARRRGADGPPRGREGPPPRASRDPGPDGRGPRERGGRRPPEERGPREDGAGRPPREG